VIVLEFMSPILFRPYLWSISENQNYCYEVALYRIHKLMEAKAKLYHLIL